MRYLSHCSSLHGTVVNTLILKYNAVATLTLRSHDVIGHLTTLYAIAYSISDTCFIGHTEI